MKDETLYKIEVTIILPLLFGAIFSLCMLHRNNQVYDLRTKMLDEIYNSPYSYDLREKLFDKYESITYDEMLNCPKTIPELEEEWDEFVDEVLGELPETTSFEMCLAGYGVSPVSDDAFSEEGKAELKEIVEAGYIEEGVLDCFEEVE